MEEEETSLPLDQTINNAVAEWCAANDKSLVTNFVFAAEFIEENGARSSAVVGLPNASLPSQLGLAHYAVNLLVEMQRRDVLEVIYVDVDDEEEF